MKGERLTDYLGFPLTEIMSADLDKIDLLSVRQKPANNILVIESNEGGRLNEHLKSVTAGVEYHHSPVPEFWKADHDTLVPHEILQFVISWISERY